MGFNSKHCADDLSRKARNVVVEYYNMSMKDAFGYIKGDLGWSMTCRRYVFYNFPIASLLVHGAQITICIFILYTRVRLRIHLLPFLVAVLYCGAKTFQGYKTIYSATFGPSKIMTKRFLELFPVFKCFGCLVDVGFYLGGFAYGVGGSVANCPPTITLHGMFNSGVSAAVAFCSLYTGITSTDAFTAVTAFVAFEFVANLDDIFVQHMALECTIEDLVTGLHAEEGYLNYILLIMGIAGGCLIVLIFIILYFALQFEG